MTDIPEDVKKLARDVQKSIGATGAYLPLCGRRDCACDKGCDARRDIIARAILADRAAQAERIRELEEALRGINGLVAAPRSSSDNDRLYAALGALDKARALARSALGGNADA
jgi:hypothetical protein